MYSIVCSEKDSAGMLMKKKFLENFGFKETEEEFDGNMVYKKENFRLVTIKEDQVYADCLNELETELIVFASKHASAKGPKTFTAHAPGNWGKAELGGKERSLCPTYASLIKNYLCSMQEKRAERKLEHLVSVEQTHHGPCLEKPAVFIEMGSNEDHWTDEKAAEVICETILEKTVLGGDYRTAIGIGGTHYNSEFTKLLLRTNYALSHMCPEYALENLDEEMLGLAVANTKEKVECLMIDYKGIGSGELKQRIKKLVEGFSEEYGIELLRVRKVLEETKKSQ